MAAKEMDLESQQEMIESLAHRLNRLQRTTTGPSDIYQVQHYPYCALDMTSRIQNQISISETKLDHVKSLSGRLGELSVYLEMEEEALNTEAIREVVLSRAGDIRQQAKELQRFDQLKEYAASVPVDVNSLQPRIRPLIELTLLQSEDTQGMTSQVQDIVARYNSAISAISNQFLVWDEVLTKLETK